jgi:hypothetical protein
MCACEEGPMAQLMVSWLVSDGRFRVHAINAVGRRKGRILEVEEVDSGERVHGSSRRLERLVRRLRQSSGELDQAPAWTPDATS